MKGLNTLPTPRAMSRAQVLLYSGPVTGRTLVRYSQWVRLDPRWGEVMVEHIGRHYRQYPVTSLNTPLKSVVWPQAFGVLLNHVPFYFKKQGLNKRMEPFKKWSGQVMKGIPPARGELFFIGLYGVGTKMALREVSQAILAYKTWGYFGRDLMINKACELD